MTDGIPDVERSATELSKSIRGALEAVQSIAENDMELHPVISPVLDLQGLRSKANTINSLFPSRSMALASSIGIGKGYEGVDDGSVNGTKLGPGTQINYTQNNYSPKPLSRIEIYRDTRNMLSTLKGVVRTNG
jgi:hypothetical protein